MNRTFKPIATSAACALLLALAALPAQAGSRYQPNAAGDEITDSQTGLIWRRCAEGQSWSGSTCAGSVQTFTWDGALARAQSQAASSGLAWRLPNAKELASLVKRSQINPAIDTTAFPTTPSDWFWTSTPYAGFASDAWFVDFYNGYVGYYDGRGDYGGAARLVRAGQ